MPHACEYAFENILSTFFQCSDKVKETKKKPKVWTQCDEKLPKMVIEGYLHICDAQTASKPYYLLLLFFLLDFMILY